jgi:hypothetical protein
MMDNPVAHLFDQRRLPKPSNVAPPQFSDLGSNVQVAPPSYGFWDGIARASDAFADTTIGRLNRFTTSRSGRRLSEQEFNESGYADMGIRWNPGMTTGELQTVLEARERQQQQQTFNDRSTIAGAIGEFVGGFGASLLDPVNLIPLGSLNIGRGLMSNVLRMGAANAAIELTTGVPAEAYVRGIEQQFYTWTDGLTSVGMAAAVGAAFAGGAFGINRLMNMNRGVRLPNEAAFGALPDTQWDAQPAPDSTVSAAPNNPTPLGMDRETPAVYAVGGPVEVGGIRFPNQQAADFYFFDRNSPQSRDLARTLGFADLESAEQAVALYRRSVLESNSGIPEGQLRVAGQLDVIDTQTLPRAAALDPVSIQDVEMELKLRNVDLSAKLTAAQRILAVDQLQEILVNRAEAAAQRSSFDNPIPVTEPERGVIGLSSKGELREYSTSEWWARQQRANLEGGAMGGNLRRNASERMYQALRTLEPEQLDWLLVRRMDTEFLRMINEHTGLAGTERVEYIENIRRSLHKRGSNATTITPEARAQAELQAQRQAIVNQRVERAAAQLRELKPEQASAVISGLGEIRSADDLMRALESKYGKQQLAQIMPLLEPELRRAQNTKEAIEQTAICLLGG